MRADVSGPTTRSSASTARRSGTAWQALAVGESPSPMPPLSTAPNSFRSRRTCPPSARSQLSARSSSMVSTRGRARGSPSRRGFLQQLARDVQRQVGRVDHALTKRRYTGISASASSMMNTRLTYSFRPPRFVAVPQVERRLGGTYSSCVYSLRPRPGCGSRPAARRVVAQSAGRNSVLASVMSAARVHSAAAWLTVSHRRW